MDYPDFSKIFHQSSKSHTKGHLPISQNESEWPQEWHTTYYKTYPRLPKIALTHEKQKADFFMVLQERKSRRDFSGGYISKKELSLLLEYSCGNAGALEEGRFRRVQPSAGARFPIETYALIIQPSEELPAGLYHYGVKEHELDVLLEKKFSDQEIGTFFSYPWVKNASMVILFTGVFNRTQSKYGERGYRYVLIEAGHIAENISLVGQALDIKCCCFGGTNDEALEELMDIDGITESMLYAVVIGK